MAKYEVVQTQFVNATSILKILWLYEEERKDTHIFEVYELVGDKRERVYRKE